MKKLFAMILASLLVFSLAACGGTPTTTPPPSDTVKTGIGVVFSNANSKNPADANDGVIDTQAYVAAVTVDKDGKIVKCVIDSMQSRFTFTADSEIKTAADTVFKTKNELGDEYNMRRVSSIEKEWNEQAAAFAAYSVGKTAEQITNIAVSEGVATDADLKASVTVRIGTFQAAVVKAVNNAVDLGAQAGDKLGIGIDGKATQTIQVAADDKPATAVAYNYYTALTVDASGKVTSCIIDASQAKFTVEDGEIATDIKAEIKTKNELGAEYNMKRVSKIEKEWNEQAAAFASYATGKTLAEIKGISLTEGKPSGADLTSSVTVTVTGFISVIDKAVTTAK